MIVIRKKSTYNKSFGAVLAIVMILAETLRADRATLQNHANAREDTRRQAAQNVVIRNTLERFEKNKIIRL